MLINYRAGLLLMLVWLTAISLAFAGAKQPLLVLDMRNTPQLPKHFRSTQTMPVSSKPLNLNGLSDLHLIGSGQFSELALKQVINKLHTKKITVVDLRQESHGFLNGNAISWYAPQDAINADKTDSEIEAAQAKSLKRLSEYPRVNVYRILQKSPKGEIEKTQRVEFAVRRVSSEETLVKKLRLHYHRLYVQDFHGPDAQQVDRFIEIVKQIKPDEWVYFHCRAGIGRTTTFMAMYDMLHHASQISYEDILARQRAMGGKDLTQLPPPSSFKYKAAVARLNFLKQFYDYAHAHQDQKWSDYLNAQPES